MNTLYFLAEALIQTGDGDNKANIPKLEANQVTLGNIMSVVYFWAGALAVAGIVYGGYLYVMSNGDSNKITQAKQAIIASITGLIFVIFAFFITQLILGSVK